jgi:hypothetical protein
MTNIRNLIDSMQSHLVILFDELKELRSRLDLMSGEAPIVSSGTVVPLFSGVKKDDEDADSKAVPESKGDSKSSESEETKEGPTPDTTKISVEPEKPAEPPNAKASRLLDPIAHELQTGESPAEIIAEYLQAAKDNLITEDNPNERVSGDMDVVLKFLRARGKKGIRPEERDNILKRIRRWKASL